MFVSFEKIQEQVANEIDNLEQLRLSYLSSIKKYGLIFLLVLIGTILVLYTCSNSWIFLTFGGLVAFSIYAGTRLYMEYDTIRSLFKEKIVGRTADKLLDTCTLPNETEEYSYWCKYDRDGCVDHSYLYQSRLFGSEREIDKIYGEDRFTGVLGLTDFQFS